MAAVANLAVYPVWLFVPGVVAKIVFVVPLALAAAPVWPLARARALAAVPGRGGAIMALLALIGVLPLTALFGWIGARTGLAPAMFAVHMIATGGHLGRGAPRPAARRRHRRPRPVSAGSCLRFEAINDRPGARALRRVASVRRLRSRRPRALGARPTWRARAGARRLLEDGRDAIDG